MSGAGKRAPSASSAIRFMPPCEVIGMMPIDGATQPVAAETTRATPAQEIP